MTVNDLILSFKLKLDKTDSQAVPDILPEEIRYWLDQSVLRFIKTRYTGNNYRRKSFEQEQKRLDDIRVRIAQDQAVAPFVSNAFEPDVAGYALPSDYMFLIRVSLKVTENDCNNISVTDIDYPKHVDHDDYHVLKRDPFNKPNRENGTLYYMQGSSIWFDCGTGRSLNEVVITYISEPRSILNDAFYTNGATEFAELAEHTHEEIVDIAVKMVLENIESQRYQTNSVEITQQE